jgi:flagellar hook assembly protein FlgD
VRTLTSGNFGPGPHDVRWNGRDNAGNPVSSGVYLYRLTAGKRSLTKKMVLLQ